MKISVIIPVFNEEKYIEKCLRSFVKQSLRPHEIIVVDDGSTDNSKLKTQNLQQKIKNLKLFAVQHRGAGMARNFGAKKSLGDILIFIDADMYLNKNYIKKIIEPIIEKKAVATFTKEEYVANKENKWSKCWSINSYVNPSYHIDKSIGATAIVFRAIERKVFFKTKGYKDIGYGEDVTVFSQLSNIKAHVAKGAICYHYNPATLFEVFVSSRWMGKSHMFEKDYLFLVRFSFLNSIRRGIIEIIKNKNYHFIVFKLVFDFGMIVGFLERNLYGKYYK